jgi:hypothetical protein
MESHQLVLESSPSGTWLLQWDEKTFVLKTPDGEVVLEAEAGTAHRLIELYDLYTEGKISFGTSQGSLVFRKNREALAAVRAFVEAGLQSDPEYRAELLNRARRVVPIGLTLFIVGGGLFGLYCWFASWAPDPPPGHWIHSFGFFIKSVLMLLMAGALGGLLMVWFGLSQLRRLQRIERTLEDKEF